MKFQILAGEIEPAVSSRGCTLLTLSLLALFSGLSCTSEKLSESLPDSEIDLPEEGMWSSWSVRDRERDHKPAEKAYVSILPGDEKFDWVLLKNGERFKGKLGVYRDAKLEFDSDEVDDQEFDWKDIKEFRSAHPYICTFYDLSLLTGLVRIVDDVVLVKSEEIETVASRAELMSIVRSGDREIDYWSGKVSMGVTLRRGNTNQTDISVSAKLQRRSPYTRVTVNYDGIVSEVRDVETVNNHRFSSYNDVFVSRRFYVTPFFLEYFRDIFQNIEHRVTPGAGVGWHLIRQEDFKRDVELDIGLGAGYRYELQSSAVDGVGEENSSVTVVPSLNYEMDVTKDVEWSFKYSAQVGLEDLKDTNQHAETRISVDLTKIIDLDVSLVWDNIGKPRPDSEGSVPFNDDIRLVVGFGIELK